MEMKGLAFSNSLKIIFLFLISYSHCDKNVTSVNDALSRECGFLGSLKGEDLQSFKKQHFFQECRNWSTISSLSIEQSSDENANNILCLLYFESFISFCKNSELSIPKKIEIVLKKLEVNIPNNEACKDLKVLPRNASHINDIIKTEEICEHFCYAFENGEFILKEMCRKAYYLNELNKERNLLTSHNNSLKEKGSNLTNSIRHNIFIQQNQSKPILSQPILTNDTPKSSPVKPPVHSDVNDVGTLLNILRKSANNTIDNNVASNNSPDGQIVNSNSRAIVESPPVAQPSIEETLPNNKQKPEDIIGDQNPPNAYQLQENSETKVEVPKMKASNEKQSILIENEGITTNQDLMNGNDPDLNGDISLGNVQGDALNEFNNQESSPNNAKMDFPNVEEETKMLSNMNLDNPEKTQLKTMPDEVQEPFPIDEADSLQFKSSKDNGLSLSDLYKLDSDMDGNSNFFTYFSFICVVFVVGYVGYHNKQKVLALLLEGRHSRRPQRGRRPNSANYHKLDTNLEEAISSSCRKNSNLIIY